jgi:cytochrome c-type biogenesis protein CcmH/NrfF
VIRRLAVLLLATLALTGAAEPAQQTTLVDVEDEVMCVSCGVPLNVAESPQASQQRAFIADLVAEGRTKDEVKQALVAEYGERVLAVPRNEGFQLAAWVLPLLLAAAGIAAVALIALRWRGQGLATRAPAPVATLTPADAARLEDDLRRYDPR